ncbi:MAG: TRAM domain-containing protein, partial [Planctomycetota bacterium]
FPTETDEEFEKSLELIRRCRFKNSFIFKYSPRPGTLAIDKYADDQEVAEEVKKYRNVRMLEVQAEVSEAVHREQVGQTLDVFVQGVSVKAKKAADQSSNPGAPGDNGSVELRWESRANEGGGAVATAEKVTQLTGRTPGDLIVMFDGAEDLVGQIVKVKIHTAKPLVLFGDRVGE